MDISATQRNDAVVLRSEELSLKLNLELEFFKVVLGWTNITNLPSFSVTNGNEKGWAMLSRELQKCNMVKEVFINNKYLVGVQRQKGKGVAIGEGNTLEQATAQALVFAYQGIYANKQQMQELKSALFYKHMQVKLPAFKQFAI